LRNAIAISGTKVGLKWTEVKPGTSPAVNVFKCAPEITGVRDCVTSVTLAEKMLQPAFSQPVVRLGAGDGIKWLPPAILEAAAGDEVNFLFEGVSRGEGLLTLVIEFPPSTPHGAYEVVEFGGVWIKLMRAREMIQRAYVTVGGVKATPEMVSDPWNYSDGVNDQVWGFAKMEFESDPDETDQCVVHVHGWRMNEDEKLNWSEMSFKRLWHQGYKGRLCSFTWPTYAPENSNLEAYATYNLSEYRAWLSGAPLRDFITSLGGQDEARRFAPGKVKVFAHSMGNVVVGSAIRSGMYVGGYVMQHAAMAAQAYEPFVKKLEHPDLLDSHTPDTEDKDLNQDDENFVLHSTDPFLKNRALGLNNQFGVNAFTPNNGRVSVINFCLPSDYALGYEGDSALKKWVWNQDWNKPSKWNVVGWYGYDPSWIESGQIDAQHSIHLRYSANLGQIALGGGRAVTDLNEAMGFVTKAITFPVGAALETRGSVAGAVDLNEFGFGEDHSAEWNWKIQQVSPYWARLILKLKLVPQSE